MRRKGHNFKPLSFLGAHGAGGQDSQAKYQEHTKCQEYTQTRQKINSPIWMHATEWVISETWERARHKRLYSV